MAKVGVFFSFEFDRDKELYGSFFAQAKNESRHAIRDCSLDKVHPPDDWEREAETRIAQCDIVVVVIGQDTHNAPGVKVEIEIAKQLGKCIIPIQPQNQNYGGVDDTGEIIPWKWNKIDAKIDESLGLK